jgi:hypothetical protein
MTELEVELNKTFGPYCEYRGFNPEIESDLEKIEEARNAFFIGMAAGVKASGEATGRVDYRLWRDATVMAATNIADSCKIAR